ncbi:MAG TPA: hypothetical protein VN515_08650 [Terriglobales bacterium]|nr:hypothetical protein [Terriglobales bacterium]
MTAMDVTYRYAEGLNPDQIRALARLSDVYGIRALRIDEEARKLAIEYDATRMDETRVQGLVRGCGVAVTRDPAVVH